MVKRVVFPLVCIFLCCAACAAGPSIHEMMAAGRVLEVKDARQLTTQKDGDVDAVWISPNGKYVACTAWPQEDKQHSGGPSLLLLPVSSGIRRVLVESVGDDRSGPTSLPAVNQERWVLEGLPATWSPDSRLFAVGARHKFRDAQGFVEQKGILVLATNGTRRAFLVFPREGVDLCTSALWDHSARRLAYVLVHGQGCDVVIRDIMQGASETVFTLEKGGLELLEDQKLNNMCVALDHEGQVTWSYDSTEIAYVSLGRACVTELQWRDPTAAEKVDAGMPLSETEERDILTNNAKQIGVAIIMYMNDWDGNYPAETGFQKNLTPYLKNKDVFFRPGTKENVFKYYPQPRVGGIDNPADRIMGTIDVGYPWQIILYVDGHVKVEPKQ